MYKTDHKKTLIDIFEKNKARAFSAPQIVEEVSEKMNKATVYRQLSSLVNDNIIRKVYNDDAKSYEYQYFDNCKNHLHLKCSGCGRIIHLNCSEADYFMNHIVKSHGFSIDQYSTTILGVCKECL